MNLLKWCFLGMALQKHGVPHILLPKKHPNFRWVLRRGGQRRRQRRCERGDRRGLRPRGYPLCGARGGWPGAGHGGGTLGVEPTLGGRCEGGVNNQPLGTNVGVFFGEGRTSSKMGRWLKMTFSVAVAMKMGEKRTSCGKHSSQFFPMFPGIGGILN